MAAEAELERMVVRLLGDGSDYQKMLSQAQKSTADTAKEVEQSAKRIEGFSGQLQGFASAAVSALGAIGLSSGLRGLVDDFAEAERGEIRLRAALQSNGRNVDDVMGRYNAFAEEIQELTTLDDDAVLGLLRQAEVMGLTGVAAQQAARDAIGLAESTDRNAESSLALIIAMQRGNVDMLRRIPQLRGIEDESLLVAEAQRLMSNGFQQAQAVARSTSGQLQQLGNHFGNLKEQLGGLVAQALKPVIDGLKNIVTWFKDLDPMIQKIGLGIVGALTGFLAFKAVSPLFSALGGSLWNMVAAARAFAFTPLGMVLLAALPFIQVFVNSP